jgi:hypothetical protein
MRIRGIDHRKRREVLAGRYVERAASIGGNAELSDAGRNEVHLGLGLDRGAPLAVALGGVGEQAQFDRLERIDHAGRVGDRGKIGVGRGRQPALELAGTDLGDVSGIYRARRPTGYPRPCASISTAGGCGIAAPTGIICSMASVSTGSSPTHCNGRSRRRRRHWPRGPRPPLAMAGRPWPRSIRRVLPPSPCRKASRVAAST